MTSSSWTCQFCGSQNKIEMYDSKCEPCEVTYHVNQPNPLSKPDSEWKLFGITYYLNDFYYYALVMHLDTEFTIIWPQHPPIKKIVIPKIFPLPKPQEAMKLVERLTQLKAFS